jgi:hypothetical protein
VRRGDVRLGDRATAYKATPNKTILAAIVGLRHILSEMGLPWRVRVFSQGEETAFREFTDIGCELNLDTPAIDTFKELVAADVLVMARSAFSYVAAILCDGVKLYDPCERKPLTHWIARDRDGRFDRSAFVASLRGHLERRAVRHEQGNRNINVAEPAAH